MLHQEQKLIISSHIVRLAKKSGSQKRLSNQAGVSTALISKIANKDFTNISDEMFRKLQVTLRIDLDWNTAKTSNYENLIQLLNTVQSRSLSIAISDHAGMGKTHVYTHYDQNYSNVIYVEAKNYWTKKSYIKQLCVNSGLSNVGKTEELIERFIQHVKGLNKPLIIIDQFDKLKDPQLDLFMDFYNDLSGACGFVLSGVKALEKRILKGVNSDKIGYAELYSRIGRKFIKLNPISLQDVELICKANGVTEQEEINHTYNVCEGDLRRVRREVERYKILNN